MAIREKVAPSSSARALSPARSDVVGPSKPRLWKILGPGLITGASDDDPSGIATYSQAGAQYGFRLSWTLLFTYPLMFVVQAISARIGRTTGRGLAGNLREHYPNVVLQGVVLLLFVANTLNIGADLAGMGEATRLLVPKLPIGVCVVGFGVLCAAGQILLKHTRYVAVLKWLSLSLFTYFAVVCVEHIEWRSVATQLVVPQFSSERGFWMMVVAILGTTISPYLFFWQAAQEVEDTKAKSEREPLRNSPSQGPAALSRIRLDTLVGMGFSNLVALAIMVSAGATLHRSGIHEISSAADAAKALEPVAGHFAFALFAVGIIGTGLLSVPVLAGSAAYALGEARRWPVGLARKPREAKAFYGAIVLATCLGGAANLVAINAVDALVWAAVLNALVAVPVMALLVLMASDRQIMGRFGISRSWKWLGWLATGVMGVASVAFLVTLLIKPAG